MLFTLLYICDRQRTHLGVYASAQYNNGYGSFAPHALKGQKLLAQGIALGIIAISKAPCFTLIEQALSVFLTLIIFNDPWVLPDEVCVIVFTFFHEGEYDP